MKRDVLAPIERVEVSAFRIPTEGGPGRTGLGLELRKKDAERWRV